MTSRERLCPQSVRLMTCRSCGYLRAALVLAALVYSLVTYLVIPWIQVPVSDRRLDDIVCQIGVFNTNQYDLFIQEQLDVLGNRSFRRSFGVVPVPCVTGKASSEVLNMTPPTFLPAFKNPCWWESVDQPLNQLYLNNGFAKYSYTYQKTFDRVRKELQKRKPSSRLRCVPYFFLAGQPKSGSTDLYNKIVSHPDVVSPPSKEPHWWGKNRYGWCLNYTATISFKEYLDLYDGAALKISDFPSTIQIDGSRFHPLITGDASVSTLWSNDDWWSNPENCGLVEPRFTNAHHIHRVIPQARIIVILRNPTDRLYSDFLFFQHSAKSQTCFHMETEAAISSLRQCEQDSSTRACVYNFTTSSTSRVRLRLGLYHIFLRDWLSVFPRPQLLVIRLEDYAADPRATLRRVHEFLDLRTLSAYEYQQLLLQPVKNGRRDSDRTLGQMWPETRSLLDTFYRPHNRELASLLKDDRFLWSDTL